MALSLKSIRYFTVAVSLGSIAKAADQLNIAASAIAAAIDQVEDAFDLTLVIRQRSRGIQATANGRRILQRFERLLEEYEAVLHEGSELKQALGGTLRVGYYAPVAPAFLPKVMSSLKLREAGAVLHLEECENDAAQDGLLDGRFDVIFFVSEGAKASIDYDVLIEAPPYCLLPAGHALASEESISLTQLAQEPLIVLDRPVAGPYYHKILKEVEAEARVAAFATSTEMVRSLVGQGLGCAVLNMSPLTRLTYGGGEVVCLPISDRAHPLTLAIAYDRMKPRRLVKQFVAACKGHFEGDGRALCVFAQSY